MPLTINDGKRLTRRSFDSRTLDEAGYRLAGRARAWLSPKRKAKHLPAHRCMHLVPTAASASCQPQDCRTQAASATGWRCLHSPICGWRTVTLQTLRIYCSTSKWPPSEIGRINSRISTHVVVAVVQALPAGRGSNSGCTQRRNTDTNARAGSLRFEEQAKLI